MSDTSQGPGWWQASDAKWYAPEMAPGYETPPRVAPQLGSPPDEIQEEQVRFKRKTWAEIRAEQAVKTNAKKAQRADNADAKRKEVATQHEGEAAKAAEHARQLAEERAGGRWWAGISKMTVAVNVRYLNVRTPTRSMGMGTLKVTEDGLQWRANLGPKVVMAWSRIEAIDIDGETTKRMTATRALTLGVFALAAKKEKRDTHMTVVTDTAECASSRRPPRSSGRRYGPSFVVSAPCLKQRMHRCLRVRFRPGSAWLTSCRNLARSETPGC